MQFIMKNLFKCGPLLFLLVVIPYSTNAEDNDVLTRIQKRAFPSLFQPWGDAEHFNDNINGKVLPLKEEHIKTLARHDLLWFSPEGYGLISLEKYPGLATSYTPESIKKALALRNAILKINPNAVLLAEVRYYADQDGYIPTDSPWWMKDSNGKRTADVPPGENPRVFYRTDFHRPDLQKRVGDLCRLVMQTHVVDGCFLDWWNNHSEDIEARTALAKVIREALGDKGILVVNTNNRIPFAASQPYINGLYMEGYNAKWFPISQWKQVKAIMELPQNSPMKTPAFTAFEGWSPETNPGRNDYKLMRMTTAMALIFSDGYVLFGDPNSLITWDHLHDIYRPFWVDGKGQRPLGRPVSKPIQDSEKDGSFRREYSQGTVVFNPPDNNSLYPVTITFKEVHRSLGTGKELKRFLIPAGDGDIFVRLNK